VLASTDSDVTRPPLPGEYDCDVLIVGGGPSGAAAAYWLAQSGADVLVVERKHFPRDKTCGDGLTPRSVRQLYEMGLRDRLANSHRYSGLRAKAFGKELVLPWPDHPDYPDHGFVVTRSELDDLVTSNSEKAGAAVWQGAEALAPLGPDAAKGGPALGVTIADKDHGTTSNVRAKYVVIADGANSRLGRALGVTRDRSIPQGVALRGYFESPRHDEPYIESHLDIRDKANNVVPGYGWIFPIGDGRVNVGVGVLAAAERLKDINTSTLMDDFVDYAPASWCLSPETACGPPTGGRLPMGLSVGPRVGPDYLIIGDAGGSINPFNGEGIAYGYETGRMAATYVSQALEANDPRILVAYETELQETYGLYYRVASSFMKLMGKPEVLKALVGTGMYSKSLMEWILRIMSNMLRPDERGPAELAYKAIVALALRRSGDRFADGLA
jgi:menaquinone-9 beta-reductase